MTEKELLVELVTHPAGYEVDLFVKLSLRPLEDGRFAVDYLDDDGIRRWEEVFEDPGEAAEFLIKTRNEMQLGFDHEFRANAIEDREVFRRWLTTTMEAKKLSLEQVAHIVGVSIPAVYRWCAGTSAPHRVMRRLAVEELEKV